MLNNLPPDILQIIVEQKSLNISDLINLSSTCSYLREFILNNTSLWKKRYTEKTSEIRNKPVTCDYFAEIRRIHEINRKVSDILINFAVNFTHKEHLSDKDFEPFIKLINNSKYLLNKAYTVGYLKGVLKDDSKIDTYDVVPLKTPGNLTIKHYSLKALHYLNHVHLERCWKKFNSLNEDEQLLEIGAVLFMQWFNPLCDEMESIRNHLDKIGEEVKSFLKIKNPNHSLFKTCRNDLDIWRNYNIKGNKFSSIECKEILEAMRVGVFLKYDVDSIKTRYERLFITDVLELKRGEFITLSIIYEAVARRLGVYLEPVQKAGNVFLTFVEHDKATEDVYYVDVANGGVITVIYSGGYINPLSRISTKEIISRMLNMLHLTSTSSPEHPMMNRSILELQYILFPNVHNTNLLAKYYINCGIDSVSSKEMNNFLKSLTHSTTHLNSKNLSTSSRNSRKFRESNGNQENVKYAVGMVMKHNLYNYTCVIYGWDPICNEGGVLKREVISNRLRYGFTQPFYYVLLENGSKRYVAQEKLSLSNVRKAFDGNPEVGRFFTHFFKNQYVPNCIKNDEYPNDFKIRKKFQC